MSTKDIQALAGFLFTLHSVGNEYNYSTGSYMHYTGQCAAVQLEELELVSKEQAEEQNNASRKAYEAKREAETS
jgi:hypothetical protein